MFFSFGNEKTQIEFKVENEKVFIREVVIFGKKIAGGRGITPNSIVYLVGGAYPGRHFNKHATEGEKLSYVSHEFIENGGDKELFIIETNGRIEVKTTYALNDGNAVLTCKKEVVNIFSENITLECVSPLALYGIMTDGNDMELPTLWKAHNTQCSEAMFEKVDFKREGFREFGKAELVRHAKYTVSNNGTQTTNRFLPLGLLEKPNYGYLLFEISPIGSWSYELEGSPDGLALVLTGKTLAENGWYKVLKPQESYVSETAQLLGGTDLDTILEELTAYRRKKKASVTQNATDVVIYNNFMQNTYDHPSEKIDAICSEQVALLGGDYYVIDAGWHDEGVKHSPTQEIGEWKENPYNYPNGLNTTLKAIREKGLKPGLWVEVQSIGIHCKKDLLPEEYFFHLGGARPGCNGRYQLDFAKQEVRERATAVIQSMIDRFSPEYIKIDYNQTAVGNECAEGSPTEGLRRHCEYYLKWFRELQELFPQVMFESCASGGMCMDEENAALSSVISFSDMLTYYTVPFATANQCFAILPEQTGIWCMPVIKGKENETTDEQVVMNMINAFYGVMHLASRLDCLSDAQKTLVKEGIAYYRSLSQVKKTAIPVLVNGFVFCEDKIVFTGMRTAKKLYLSCYNMSDKPLIVEKNLSKYGVDNVRLVYPTFAKNVYSLTEGKFICELEGMTARTFEFELKA